MNDKSFESLLTKRPNNVPIAFTYRNANTWKIEAGDIVSCHMRENNRDNEFFVHVKFADNHIISGCITSNGLLPTIEAGKGEVVLSDDYVFSCSKRT